MIKSLLGSAHRGLTRFGEAALPSAGMHIPFSYSSLRRAPRPVTGAFGVGSGSVGTPLGRAVPSPGGRGLSGIGAGNVLLSSVAGGAISYMSGGDFGQGMVAGAAVGGMAAGGTRALANRGMLARGAMAFRSSALGQRHGGVARGLTSMAVNMRTKESRRYLFGGGALLGGIAFGGERNKRTGFNARRGTTAF